MARQVPPPDSEASATSPSSAPITGASAQVVQLECESRRRAIQREAGEQVIANAALLGSGPSPAFKKEIDERNSAIWARARLQLEEVDEQCRRALAALQGEVERRERDRAREIETLAEQGREETEERARQAKAIEESESEAARARMLQHGEDPLLQRLDGGEAPSWLAAAPGRELSGMFRSERRPPRRPGWGPPISPVRRENSPQKVEEESVLQRWQRIRNRALELLREAPEDPQLRAVVASADQAIARLRAQGEPTD